MAGEDDPISEKGVFSTINQRIKKVPPRGADLSLGTCLGLIRAAEKFPEQIVKVEAISTPQANAGRPDKNAHPGKATQTRPNHSYAARCVRLFSCSRHVLKKEIRPA